MTAHAINYYFLKSTFTLSVLTDRTSVRHLLHSASLYQNPEKWVTIMAEEIKPDIEP